MRYICRDDAGSSSFFHHFENIYTSQLLLRFFLMLLFLGWVKSRAAKTTHEK